MRTELTGARAAGKGVTAIPYAGRPETPAFDGTWAGDVGFDPLVISGNLDMKWLREAELKHGRVAMLAAAGSIAQARPPPPLRTNRTRRVPHPVLIGHATSLTPYARPACARACARMAAAAHSARGRSA
jgi:hypothetical protein